jgi:hypothetical protein
MGVTQTKEVIMINITSGHVRACQVIRSQLYDNITLWSCTINGEPGVAIVMVDDVGEGKIAVMPLFVAITPNMDLSFPGERGSSDGACGPKNPREAFQSNKTVTAPACYSGLAITMPVRDQKVFVYCPLDGLQPLVQSRMSATWNRGRAACMTIGTFTPGSRTKSSLILRKAS